MNNAQKRSILVVDDENSNIMVLSHILSPDYTVYVAKNGKNAIHAAEKYLPDIILLDIIMPEMDGYAIIAALKESEKTRDTPVIFITGLNNADDEERGLTLGAVDYIIKPFSPAIVKLRVRNQIKMLDQYNMIERLSMLDQLTELPNRRSFDNRLHVEWGRAMREQEPISILLMDVDRFKKYNDTYGHQQGDIALQSVAGNIQAALKRSCDFAARWGGEEFIALLPNTCLGGALEIAEQIRGNIENMEIPFPSGTATKVTISIGVHTWKRGSAETITGFISKADEALYTAKKTGRNRVCPI